jgi:hypothetical protein
VSGGGLKIGGGLGLLVLLAVVLLGGDPLQFLDVLVGDGGGGTPEPVPAGQAPAPAADDEPADFTTSVLAMTEDTWSAIFSEAGGQYRPPVLVMFTDATRSACGLGSSATGPFYCPPDERIYIDLGFFNDLAQMAGISSSEFDFAAAYVIAHEVGHHVQNLLGTSDEVRQAQARSPGEANRLSVLLELQADCFAGVWANRTRAPDGRSMLEPGDVQEGMRAAAAIGDDRLARSAGRSVSPESFTHGTSEQRRHWLETGLESGRTESCDTFAQAGYR